MDVVGILKEWLAAHGRCGLVNEDVECCCTTDDLVPCSDLDNLWDCVPVWGDDE